MRLALLPWADEAALVRHHDELGPVAGVELRHHVTDVGLRRGGTDVEPLTDLTVRQPPSDQSKDFTLPSREDVELRWRGRLRFGPRRQLFDDPAGDARREECIAAGDDPDRVEHVLRWCVLEQEPAGAGPDRA